MVEMAAALADGGILRFLPRQILLVRYPGDPLYHERLLLVGLDASLASWVVLHPDGDMYIEELVMPTLDDIRVLPADGRLPAGIRAMAIHTCCFHPPPDEYYIESLMPRAIALAGAERRRLIRAGLLAAPAVVPIPFWAGGRGQGRARPLVDAGLIVDAEAGIPDDIAGSPGFDAPEEVDGRVVTSNLGALGAAAPVCTVWVVDELVAGMALGTEVDLPRGSPTIKVGADTFALAEIKGVAVRLRAAAPAKIAAYAETRIAALRKELPEEAVAEDNLGGLAGFNRRLQGRDDPLPAASSKEEHEIVKVDARVLPTLLYRGGEGYREFGDVVTKVELAGMDSWPLEGPRTTLWVIEYVRLNGGSFAGRHLKWVQTNALNRTDPRIVQHEILSEALDWFMRLDQLDVVNLVGIECLVRQYQLIEETIFPLNAGQEEALHFKGRMRSAMGTCVCPELASWVAERVKSNNEILEAPKEGQELRDLQRQPPEKK